MWGELFEQVTNQLEGVHPVVPYVVGGGALLVTGYSIIKCAKRSASSKPSFKPTGDLDASIDNTDKKKKKNKNKNK